MSTFVHSFLSFSFPIVSVTEYSINIPAACLGFTTGGTQRQSTGYLPCSPSKAILTMAGKQKLPLLDSLQAGMHSLHSLQPE